MYITIESAQEWYEHIHEVLESSNYKYAQVKLPKEEPHAIVTRVGYYFTLHKNKQVDFNSI